MAAGIVWPFAEAHGVDILRQGRTALCISVGSQGYSVRFAYTALVLDTIQSLRDQCSLDSHRTRCLVNVA